mmetsp:Transcript_12513/g.38209  ORF Transcript_12513/g.38209 Transcript_12513/m.38209 type:complete len:360 (+) Transcript_12513:106-1185(+)
MALAEPEDRVVSKVGPDADARKWAHDELTVLRDENNDAAVAALREDVKRGLSAGVGRKSLSSAYFYDDAGSVLFSRITELDCYYLTRKEFEILRKCAQNMVKGLLRGTASRSVINIVELGAGDGRKTCILLDELLRQNIKLEYFPIDISKKALEMLSTRINDRYDGRVRIHSVVADNRDGLHWIRRCYPHRRNITLFLGSSIGNFDRDCAQALFCDVRKALKKGDRLLIGFDLLKDPETMRRAYSDSQQITAEFNRNLLYRINRELGANFRPDLFYHVASYNARQQGMESHLVSRVDQTVDVPGVGTFDLQSFEGIHTECSFKYTPTMTMQLADSSQFQVDGTYFDADRWFMDQIWVAR